MAGLGAGPGADDAGADGAVGCAEAFRTCPHTFALQDFAGVAHDVQLWGVFPPNVWASGITMQKSGASWFVAADVPWGFDVHYKYLVDGVWLVDPSLESPAVPDIQGGGMSSVLPGDSCAMWDCGAIEVPDCPESERAAQVRMVIEDAGYQAVGIAGSFNDWLPSAMSRVGSQWAVNVPELPWGSHIEYKFVVDGQWIRDPSNTITNPDGFGGENSVLRVEGDWWSCHG